MIETVLGLSQDMACMDLYVKTHNFMLISYSLMPAFRNARNKS
jgi:hypothetical protein